MNKYILIPAALLLGACDSAVQRESYAPVPQAMMSEADLAPSDSRAKQTDTGEAVESFLAYRYGYNFTLPVSAVEATMSGHLQTCRDAGPALCQIMGSNSSTYGEDRKTASLSFRAQPDWLIEFTQTMQSSVKKADGRLTGTNTTVEDLTRSILDTDARLGAQRALRMRLQTLLETKSASLSDLLEVERELARVQGEIESATATLKVLRSRVSMSRVDVSYDSKASPVGRSAFSPIREASRDFFGNIAYGLGGVITAIAFILPWFIFIGLPVMWLFRRWRRSRKIEPTQVSKPKPQKESKLT